MQVHINHVPIGTLQAISVSITRETGPIYTAGDPNAKAFVRGKRAIGGSLSFSTFDRHALINDAFEKQIFGTTGGKSQWYTATDRKTLADIAATGSYYASNYNTITPAGRFSLDKTGANTDVQEVIKNYQERELRYSDELPPFNVTLTLVNDFGSASTCSINGIVLVNEGSSYTIDDLTNSMAFTYLARAVTPLSSLTSGLFTQSDNGISASQVF